MFTAAAADELLPSSICHTEKGARLDEPRYFHAILYLKFSNQDYERTFFKPTVFRFLEFSHATLIPYVSNGERSCVMSAACKIWPLCFGCAIYQRTTRKLETTKKKSFLKSVNFADVRGKCTCI